MNLVKACKRVAYGEVVLPDKKLKNFSMLRQTAEQGRCVQENP
jgi:hypothetical protein